MGAELWEEGPGTSRPSSAAGYLISLMPGPPTGLQRAAEDNLPTLSSLVSEAGHDHLPLVSALGPTASLKTTSLPPSWEDAGEGSLGSPALSSAGFTDGSQDCQVVCWFQSHRLFRPILLLSAPSSCCPLMSHRPFPPSFRHPSGHYPSVGPFLSVEEEGAEKAAELRVFVTGVLPCRLGFDFLNEP